MSDDIVENLKEPSQWLRIAYMLALAVALYVASIVLTLLTIAQALFSLLTGNDNENLRALGKDLSTYVHQILEFLTYNSEIKPFPFSPYPDAQEEVFTPPSAPTTPTKKAAAKRQASTGSATKSPAKKATTPRKAAGKKSSSSTVDSGDMKPEV